VGPAELRAALAVADGTARIGPSQLAGTSAPRFLAFLNRYYGGRAIEFERAQLGLGDGPEQVVVAGRSTFLGVRDLPVLGTFRVDPVGQDVVASVRYGPLPVAGPGAWRWSTSFPALPSVYQAGLLNGVQQPALDRLEWEPDSPHFIVCTDPVLLPGSADPLPAGVNFVATMRPPTFIPLSGIFRPAPAVRATVVAPDPLAPPPVVPRGHRPWTLGDLVGPAPGITLRSALAPPPTIGPMTILDAQLVLYSPPDVRWMAEHTGFDATIAYSAKLAIPSAGLAVDVHAEIVPGVSRTVLAGDFDGLALGQLAHLADLAGGPDLAERLPAEIADFAHALEGLSLLELAVSIDASGASRAPVSVDYVFFGVGMPAVRWTAVDGLAAITGVRVFFFVESPFQRGRDVRVTLVGDLEIAGIQLAVSAEFNPFSVRAQTTEPVAVPLSRLLADHAPDVNAPTDLVIEEVRAGSDGREEYVVDMTAADDSPWTLDVGHTGLTVSNVSARIYSRAGGGSSVTFRGRVVLDDDAELSVVHEASGPFQVHGRFPRIELSRLIERLCDVTIALPATLDLTLENSSVLIEDDAGSLRFVLATALPDVGALAFEAKKLPTEGWGFAAGVDLDAGIASLPGMDALEPLESLFSLDKLTLLVSSLDATAISFPDMTAVGEGALESRVVRVPPRAARMGRGVYAFAEMRLGGSTHEDMMRALLGMPAEATLDATIEISDPPSHHSRVYTTVNAMLGTAALVAEFGASLDDGQPTLFLDGTVDTQIDGTDVRFSVGAVFETNGALLSGTMTSDRPVSFWGIQLADVALQVGISVEGVPSFGIAADLAREDFHASFAIFLNGTTPGESMLAGSVSDFSLADVVRVLAQQEQAIGYGIDEALEHVALHGTHGFSIPASMADALDRFELRAVADAFAAQGVTVGATHATAHVIVGEAGTAWFLTDLASDPPIHYELKRDGDWIYVAREPQVYIVPVDTSIGTLRFREGYRVSGAIEFFGWRADVDARMSRGRGVTVDAVADPLVIGRPELLSITGADGTGGPRVSIDTADNPHFRLSGRVHLLGVDALDVDVDVSRDGCAFHLDRELVPGTSFDVHGAFDGSDHFEAAGTVSVGLDTTIDLTPIGAELGQVPIDVTVGGSVDIVYHDGALTATMVGRFEFQGTAYEITAFDLSVDTGDLARLGEIFEQRVADTVLELARDADEWLTMVRDGLVTGVDTTAEAIGHALTQDLALGAEDAARLTAERLGYGVDQMADALQGAGLAASEASATLVRMGAASADDVTRAIAGAFDIHADSSTHVDTEIAPRINQETVPHGDLPGLHMDTQGTEHGDATVLHTDGPTAGGGHWDAGHTDVPGIGHGDSWTPHTDTPAAHIDSERIHNDATTHIDTG
jgi:hypothetical protein